MKIFASSKISIVLVILAPFLALNASPAKGADFDGEPAFCDAWREYRDGDFYEDYAKRFSGAEAQANRFRQSMEAAQQILDEMNKWGVDGIYSAEFLGSEAGEIWLQSVNLVKLKANLVFDTIGLLSNGKATQARLTAEQIVSESVAKGINIVEGVASSGVEITTAKVLTSEIPVLGPVIVLAWNAIENAEKFEQTNTDINVLRADIEHSTLAMMGHIRRAAEEYERRISGLEAMNDTKNAFDGLCGNARVSKEDDSGIDFSNELEWLEQESNRSLPTVEEPNSSYMDSSGRVARYGQSVGPSSAADDLAISGGDLVADVAAWESEKARVEERKAAEAQQAIEKRQQLNDSESCDDMKNLARIDAEGFERVVKETRRDYSALVADYGRQKIDLEIEINQCAADMARRRASDSYSCELMREELRIGRPIMASEERRCAQAFEEAGIALGRP